MAKQRVLAELIDLAIVVGWAVLMIGGVAALGAWRFGLQHVVFALEWHAVALALIVVPVCLAAGLAEAGRYRGTPGKRRTGLRIVGQTWRMEVTKGRAIARNALKYAPSLVFVYVAALAMATSAGVVQLDNAILVGIAIAVLVLTVAGVFFGRGTALYDAIAGLRVAERAGRRVLAGTGSSSAAPRRAL